MGIFIDEIVLSPRQKAIEIFIVSINTSGALPTSFKHLKGAMIGIKALNTRRYACLCNTIHSEFHPLGLDTHSGLGRPAQAVLALLAYHFARLRGKNSSAEYLRLPTTISPISLPLTAHAVCCRSLALVTA